MHKMKYRLALDLGSTSLGWAMIRLDKDGRPCAIIKAGVRIFSNGRNPKDNSSLAVVRREARSMRRRRDRLLKRKKRMMHTLVEYGFLPADITQCKKLEILNPYSLRAKGLDQKLTPEEFGRALLHINQRRGFKSNRKVDKGDGDSGALKSAIKQLRESLVSEGCRTVGEWLHKRDSLGLTVRARYRQSKFIDADGKNRTSKSYDLYVDRAMIEDEFDVLWAAQSSWNPTQFSENARKDLKDVLLHQRTLKPIKPGRCTFLPEEERAPLALPSTQRFRMYQEVNNLRILYTGMKEGNLTVTQRDILVAELEKNRKCSFTQIKKLLGLKGIVQFNFEDPKRRELYGNLTSAILSRPECFGSSWFEFDEAKQDEIVMKLIHEENEARLIRWLQSESGVDEMHAEYIANAGLPEGYGQLSVLALARILPELRRDVITYDVAVKAAGFDHHSQLSDKMNDSVLPELPYYGLALQRHVGFGSNDSNDCDEERYGRISNPTVHIGLNQVRLVVNSLIKRYGHPAEAIIEVARELKQSKASRTEENFRQAENQKRNARIRSQVAGILQIREESVKTADIQKMILWEQLSFDPADRRCPYSGKQISASMLFTGEVEIEHILPFSMTLDDSLNNKTVAWRVANRLKGNDTPWGAFGLKAVEGFDYAEILARAEKMPREKRYRFAEDGYQRWLKGENGFLARALNDTRYMSRLAREYVSLICRDTRVIPGQMTALLRGKFGLNSVLSLKGEKNRHDHRHHAVDACVIGVTDQAMLQRFSSASAAAREMQLDRLVENTPMPWGNYREHVQRAIDSIWVSHKPDHSHEGAMHNDTAYGLIGNGKVRYHKNVDGQRCRIEESLKVIEISSGKAASRHGLENGQPKAYKGYKGDSNYCFEIVRNETGKWEGEVVSTFDAYQCVRQSGVSRIRQKKLSVSGKPLVMRLMIDDTVRIVINGVSRVMRVATLSANGQVFMADVHEANVDARNRDKLDSFNYLSKRAGSFFKAEARQVTISPIGELRDPGFSE